MLAQPHGQNKIGQRGIFYVSPSPSKKRHRRQRHQSFNLKQKSCACQNFITRRDFSKLIYIQKQRYLEKQKVCCSFVVELSKLYNAHEK